MKGNQNDILVSAPVAPEQEILLPHTGMARLVLETPRTSAEYRNLRIELAEKHTGQIVMATYSLKARGRAYSLTTMHVLFGPATMMRAGAYVARISGLQAGNNYSRYRLMISRPLSVG